MISIYQTDPLMGPSNLTWVQWLIFGILLLIIWLKGPRGGGPRYP